VVLGTLDPAAGLPREAEMMSLTVQIGDTIGGDVGGEGGVHLVLQELCSGYEDEHSAKAHCSTSRERPIPSRTSALSSPDDHH
jgi:hypothetical protein